MPFTTTPDAGTPDTTELNTAPPPQALPAYQDDTGTGANGPKYDTGEFWSAIGRQTLYGHAITNYKAMQASGYSPLGENTELPNPYEAIPEDMKPYADKFVGLHSAEEIMYRTFQLRQAQWDATHGLQSKWAWPANLAAGLTDPIGAAAMFLPGGATSRLGTAVHAAIVGGGVAAADEAALSQLDPNWELADAMKDVGAGTLLSGLLGAALHARVPRAERERMRSTLNEDLNAPAPEPAPTPSGDTAANIAADLRQAVEAHAAGLQATAEQARATAPDPAEAAQRVQAAQEALDAVSRETTPEALDATLKAEQERLQSGEGVPERLARQYGDEAPQIIAARAQAAVDAKIQARQAAEDALNAAQEDANRATQAAQAQAALEEFHATASPQGYTESHGQTEPVPFDVRPEGEPGLRSELRPEQEPAAAGAGESGGSVPGRSPRGAARGAQRAAGASEPRPRQGRARRLGVGAAPNVEAHIQSQLDAVGRAPPEVNARQAALVGDFYATQARRLGISPDELFAQHPLKVTGETTPAALHQGEEGIDVGERAMTPEEEKLFAGLRDSGTAAPLKVFRGGRGGPVTPEHFLPESLGKNTGRPSAGLGVFFTNDRAEAATYGKVTEHHLDMRNPLKVRSYDLPPFDSPQEAMQWAAKVKAAGHDGLVIDASGVGGQTWYVPFEHEQVKPAGEPLRQGERGTYDPAAHTIGLAETADRSTFLHEAAHHFLDVLTQLAEHGDAPQGMKDDVATLMRWFGIKDLDEWHGLGLDGQRASHEKFAQGFEQYLRDGTAPSVRLQSVFDQFREWLTQIYKTVVNQFGDRLPQDVREVMDRMLATDEEIKAATAARVAAAPTPTLARVAGDAPLRDELRHMAEREVGWAQEGGKMIRLEVNGGRGNEFDISRTSWIPNANWWPDRPGGYSAEDVRAIVDKALAGERLGPKQQRLVEYMTQVADQRVASAPFIPKPSELHIEHTPANAFESAMVARLASIDEAAVENLARHFEDDDAGFMAKVKELLDAHDESARLSFGVPEDQEPVGISPDRGTAGRPAGEAGGRGQESRTAASEAGGGPQGPAAAGGRGRPRDLFGEPPTAAQQLADEQRRRDLKRNSGQESLETGNPGDLFSQARQQTDLADMLQRLPPEARAPFEQRIAALPEPGHTPIYAAPEGGQSMGAGAVDDRAQGLKDYSYARGGRVLGKALGWFAPGSRAMSSPFLSMRKTMARLVETPEMLEMNVPTPERPFGLPTPMSVQTVLKRWEGKWAEGFKARDEFYRAYRQREQGVGEGPKIGKHEFNEQVSMAMRRGDTWFIPEVEKAAQATRRIVFDPLKVECQQMGLLPPNVDELIQGTADSYLMRQYDRAKIQADQLGWHQTLVDGFVKQGVEAAEAGDIAHGVTRNILGTELGLLDTDKALFHNVQESGRLISRKLLMPDLALEKYLTNDIDVLSHSYLKSLAPQLEMLKAFRDDLRNDGLAEGPQAHRLIDPQDQPSSADLRNLTGPAKDIVDEHAILKQRALAAGDNEQANALDKRLRSDLKDLAAVRDRLYGIYGAPGDSASWIQRAGRFIRSFNALRLLGTATWSHVPDLANVVMKRGLVNTMATAAKLSSNLEALNLNREQTHRIGAALDMIHNSTAAQLGEFGVESSYAVQKAMNRATRAFTIATLETPWIASCKMLASAAAHDEVIEAATRARAATKPEGGAGLSTAERIRFNQMGLDQQTLVRIADEFDRHGKTVNGLRFGMTDKWDDKGAAQMLDGVTNNAAEGSTLSPGAGDTPLWTSSEVGKAIFQFKTFGAVAIRRVTIPLAQGLAHADLRSASGLATLIAAGAATYTMKQLLSGQPIEKDPGRYALEVLDKSNLLGWTGEYFYPSLWQFGAGNFSRWGDRQTWETLGGPVAGTAVDAWDLRLPAKLIGTLKGDPKNHLTRSDIHRVRRMLPGNQVWYLRRAVNALEGKVGDSLGLPPAPTPGSTE